MMQFSSVHPNARIAANVEIGPYCYIAENVEIGEGCVIGPHVTIFDYVKIGKNCKIFPGAVIGAIPQDMKYSGEVTWVESSASARPSTEEQPQAERCLPR